MTTPPSRFSYARIARLSPVALLMALALIAWMAQRHHRVLERFAILQNVLSSFYRSATEEAQDAFAAGEFQRAAALLDPAVSESKADAAALLVRARSLECLGYFREGAEAYAVLEQIPGRHLAIKRGKAFCERMASERMPARIPSREVLYRLHDELMRRGDPASARFIARKLLPDAQPLRESLLALLRQLDGNAKLTIGTEAGLVDVTISQWQPHMPEVLRDVQIDHLNLTQSRLEDARELSGLDVRSLNLSNNHLSDITPLRNMPLHWLQLECTNIADVRPLAGLPLHELNLAHTMVGSVQPLVLCPLQKLNLSYTAVHSIESLRGMELRELDLSHTRVADLGPLAGMPLERLVLNDTPVHDLRTIAGARLNILSLVGTAVKDLDALAGMPLTEIDLRGCELLTDVQALASCPHLEHVYLPRHLKAPPDHWQLPHLKFIDYERRGETAIAQK